MIKYFQWHTESVSTGKKINSVEKASYTMSERDNILVNQVGKTYGIMENIAKRIKIAQGIFEEILYASSLENT